MFMLNENDREYRFGDSGPKYLMKGPRSNFAVVQFQACLLYTSPSPRDRG